jgi:membrane fusion protein, copper/silver efflux system
MNPEDLPASEPLAPELSVPTPPVAAPTHPSQRSLRIMATVRWLLLAVVTALAAYTVWTEWGPKAGAAKSAGPNSQGQGPSAAEVEIDRYVCPMHPQIRSPYPGECPICHMTLVPIPEDRHNHSHTPSSSPEASSLDAAGEPQEHDGAMSPPDTMAITLSGEKQRAVGVVTTPVESATLGDRLRVPGVISAPETGLSQVRVRAPGFVEKVVVRQTGVRVSRGQPLAYVYSPEIYRAQEEFLAASRWGAASGANTANGENAASPGADNLVSAARRGLELLGLNESDIEEVVRTGHAIRAIPVRAPAGGYVTRFNAVLGSRAEPEMVLYEIADLSSLWVIASVPERDLGAIRSGTPARFSSSSSPEPLSGRVDLVEPSLEESTRTSRVRLVIQNKSGQLRPGQFGEVEFELPASAGLFVPRDAVIRTGEHEYVYVAVSAERFEPRLVKIGLAREGRLQIVSGVEEGERVVTRGSFMVDSESRLQASLAAAPAPKVSSATSSDAASPETGPSCEAAFDSKQYPDKYNQCRACERQHAGMGSMVADCKNAIEKPWR